MAKNTTKSAGSGSDDDQKQAYKGKTFGGKGPFGGGKNPKRKPKK